MSDTTNWFARKMGTAPQGAPPPAAPPRTPTPAPQQYQQPQQYQAPAPADPNDVKPGEPGSFSYAMKAGQTSGGPAHKSNKVSTCPGCGSGNYIEMPNGHSCFDCGYPVIQYGSELGEGNMK